MVTKATKTDIKSFEFEFNAQFTLADVPEESLVSSPVLPLEPSSPGLSGTQSDSVTLLTEAAASSFP
ncbi:MAG: hypothetical protein HYU98_07210 [Deltaproteobacteria bacterium]|nr:hypothetical protein [Deltaproteobacteria bacterium]